MFDFARIAYRHGEITTATPSDTDRFIRSLFSRDTDLIIAFTARRTVQKLCRKVSDFNESALRRRPLFSVTFSNCCDIALSPHRVEVRAKIVAFVTERSPFGRSVADVARTSPPIPWKRYRRRPISRLVSMAKAIHSRCQECRYCRSVGVHWPASLITSDDYNSDRIRSLPERRSFSHPFRCGLTALSPIPAGIIRPPCANIRISGRLDSPRVRLNAATRLARISRGRGGNARDRTEAFFFSSARGSIARLDRASFR